ncbi:MAG: nucleoside-triphosphatase [Thermoleophilia bacterium]
MINNILITGEPRVGKTTAIKKIIYGIGKKYFGGFYSEEICIDDHRTGFQLITLDGRVGQIADINLRTGLQVGRYGVNLDFLESTGIPTILSSIQKKPFIVVDEIGPMQAYSFNFRRTIEHILASDQIVLGTIFQNSSPWIDDIRRRRDIIKFELIKTNREATIEGVRKLIKEYDIKNI